MPTSLSDPSPTLYAFLAIVVIVLFLVFQRRGQKRGDFVRLILGAGIMGAVVLIDLFVESPREESTRKLREMAAASKEKKIEGIAKHMSESFSYNGMDKAKIIERFQGFLSIVEFNGVDVTGFGRKEFQNIDDNTVKVHFEVWPSSYGLPEYRRLCWATFVKDPDGEFRLKSFDLYSTPTADKPDVPVQLQ